VTNDCHVEEGEEEEVLLTACNIWVVLAKWHASLMHEMM